MKKKIINELPVTKNELDNAIQNFHESFRVEIEDLLMRFRSDIFNRFDELMGELAQIREDQVFANYERKELKETDQDHEIRLQTLEE